MNKIVRAVDVGFGNTKLVANRDKDGMTCRLFPSLAPMASSRDLSSGVLAARDTYIVEVEGVRYEVGPDAALALRAHHSRKLDSAFATTDTYLALLRGALSMMDADTIDMLVVGLPVSSFSLMRQGLETRLPGCHPVAGRRQVVVREVRALPQPIGGFFDYALSTGLYGSMKHQVNLVVDPGFFTLDWLTAFGIKPIDARSGSHPGGMSQVLRIVVELLAQDIGADPSDLDPAPIDAALRLDRRAVYFGREYDLRPYLPQVRRIVEESVAALAQSVGNGSDIAAIIMVGGGARLFFDVLQRQYPRHRIITLDDPIFANVRGFQLAGEEWVKVQPARG